MVTNHIISATSAISLHNRRISGTSYTFMHRLLYIIHRTRIAYALSSSIFVISHSFNFVFAIYYVSLYT